MCVCVCACVLPQYSERSSCLVGTVATAMSLWSCGSKLIAFRLRAAATSRRDTEQLGRQRADLFHVRTSVLTCMCVGVFLFFFFMSDSTGLLELITPPAPDLRSLGGRAEGAAACAHRSLNNTQSPRCSTFHHSDSGDTLPAVASEGAHRGDPVHSLLSRIIMQVLPFFYDYYERFTLNYKEGFFVCVCVCVDVAETVALSNVKRTPDVPVRLNLLSEEIARRRGHLLMFRTLLCKMNGRTRPPSPHPPNCEQH